MQARPFRIAASPAVSFAAETARGEITLLLINKTDEEVVVELAFRGEFYSVEGATRYYPLLSVVVSSDGREVAFGEKLPLEQRVRLAILIDHHFNGTEEIPRGA